MFAARALAVSLMAACSGASAPTPTQSPVTSSPPVASARVEAPTVAPPTVSRSTQPSERLAFELSLFGSERRVSASLEVPKDYGIVIDKGDAVLAGCRASAGIASAEMKHFWMSMRGVGLRARACDAQEPKACIEKALGAGDKERVVWKGERQAQHDAVSKAKDGRPRYEGSVVAYDDASNAVVICSYALSEEVGAYRSDYFRVCGSLALTPNATMAKAATRNATLSDVEREDLSDAKDKTKLRHVVEGFIAAMGKRDYQQARKFMVQASDCKKFFGKDTARVKSCAAEADTAAGFLKEGAFPQAIEVAAIRIAHGDGLVRAPGAKKHGFYEVLVMPKGSECSVEVPVFIVAIGDEYRVALPMKKE